MDEYDDNLRRLTDSILSSVHRSRGRRVVEFCDQYVGIVVGIAVLLICAVTVLGSKIL